MKFLELLSRSFLLFERSLVITMLGVMVLLAFLQVILRNFFSTGIPWADTILRHMVLWMAFLGASLATQREKHISIDIITRFLSPRFTNLARIATNLFACGVSLALADAGMTFLRNEIESQSVLIAIGTKELPTWWFQVVIPAGFALIAFRLFLRALDHIARAFRPGSDESGKHGLTQTPV